MVACHDGVVVLEVKHHRERTVACGQERVLNRQHGVERAVVGQTDPLDEVATHLVDQPTPRHRRNHQIG